MSDTRERPAAGAPDSEHELRAARTDREMVYHPAFDDHPGRALPAGKVILLIAVALLVAFLLNTSWVVRTAQSIKVDWVRNSVLAVAEPVDSFAHAVWLNEPKDALDTALGHPPLEGGSAVEDSNEDPFAGVARPVTPSTAPSAGPEKPGPGKDPTDKPTEQKPPAVVEPAVRKPTAAAPLKLLVMGDSLATYPAYKIESATAGAGKVDSELDYKDGTGLTTPDQFNWIAYAQQKVQADHPDAVFMLIGGNDRQPMEHNGQVLTEGSDEWVQEYTRRVGLMMKGMLDAGVQRVYWGGPPVARSGDWNQYYKLVNKAVKAAVAQMPGSRYVDLYNGTSDHGRYQENRTLPDGSQVDARQGDGIHWTQSGSIEVAALTLDVMEKDYGPLEK